jgi:hypothetical protein
VGFLRGATCQVNRKYDGRDLSQGPSGTYTKKPCRSTHQLWLAAEGQLGLKGCSQLERVEYSLRALHRHEGQTEALNKSQQWHWMLHGSRGGILLEKETCSLVAGVAAPGGRDAPIAAQLPSRAHALPQGVLL